MKIINCPVCGGGCNGKAGVSSHLFKDKDLDHRRFVEWQNHIIDEAFSTDISCEFLAARDDCWVSTNYICERWKRLPGYKERKSRINTICRKREWQHGQRQVPKGFTNAGQPYDLDKKTTISREQHDQIVVLFTSDLGATQIAEQIGCNRKTVLGTFVREFGTQAAKERGRRLNSLTAKAVVEASKIENSNPELADRIADAFHGDEGMKTVNARLGGGSMAIRRIWLERFGQAAYDERCAKLLRLQRERAAKTLDKARFAGSQNEILCHKFLVEKLPGLEVIHHDYSVVPRLELDITIPSVKVAITWDGVGHRKPAFGEKAFRRVCANDKRREAVLAEKGWRHISVVDEGGYNPTFTGCMVDEIIALLEEEDWTGKKVLE
jgi:hypothetical protein